VTEPASASEFDQVEQLGGAATAVAKLAPARADLRLDLACGEKAAPGFTGVDLYAPGMQKVDLTKFPWPWAAGSVVEARCSHYVEHLPMVYVEPDGSYSHVPSAQGVDLFLRFFNELYRVMAPGAQAAIVVPALQSPRAFQDPTHRRFLCAESFAYLSKGFRSGNGLEHYLHATCDFEVFCVPSVLEAEQVRAAEVQALRLRTLWGVAYDWHVKLVKADRVADEAAAPRSGAFTAGV
jgi:hypothetical protein